MLKIITKTLFGLLSQGKKQIYIILSNLLLYINSNYIVKIYSNGDTYQGNWVEGQKHGFGVWKACNGDMYKGDWNKSRYIDYQITFHNLKI